MGLTRLRIAVVAATLAAGITLPTVTGADSALTNPAIVDPTLVDPAPAPTDIATVEPIRLLDTRDMGTTHDGQHQGSGIVEAGTTRVVDIAGRVDIPADALGVQANLTAIRPGGSGYATLYPCTDAPPNASTLNFSADTNTANATLTPLSSAGTVCIFSSESAHYALDIFAFTPGTTTVGFVTPTRLLDTRVQGTTTDGLHANAGPTAANVPIEIQITGRANVPVDATGVHINLTAVNPESSGFATVYPCTDSPPVASTLNFSNGTNTANATLTQLSPTGTVCVVTNTPAHLIVDISAHIPPGNEITPITPARLADSRSNRDLVDGNTGNFGDRRRGATISFEGRGGVPFADFLTPHVSALEVNLTIIRPEEAGFATVFPCTEDSVPLDEVTTSTVNFEAGETASNSTIVQVRPFGQLCMRASLSTHYAVDIVGYSTVEPDSAESRVWLNASERSNTTTYPVRHSHVHSADGTVAAVPTASDTGGLASSISLVDTDTRQVIATLDVDGFGAPFRLSPDGTELIYDTQPSFEDPHSFHVWNVSTGLVTSLGADPCTHSFGPEWDGLASLLYPRESQSPAICALDGAAGDIEIDPSSRSNRTSRNGRYLVEQFEGFGSRQVALTDVTTGDVVRIDVGLWRLPLSRARFVSDNGDVLLYDRSSSELGMLPAGATSIADLTVLPESPLEPNIRRHNLEGAVISEDGSTVYLMRTVIASDDPQHERVVIEALNMDVWTQIGAFDRDRYFDPLFGVFEEGWRMLILETAGDSVLVLADSYSET